MKLQEYNDFEHISIFWNILLPITKILVDQAVAH